MPCLRGRAVKDNALISAQGLHVHHGDLPVLHGIDLAIARGEIVTLVGPNGSGKSTLIKALLGVVPASAGNVTRAPGLRIGYVPQTLSLDATLPMPVARFLSLPTRHAKAEIAAALERTGVAGLEARQLSALSGGQRQRVLLARALLGDPDILILDEPTQGLDQPGIAAFYALVAEVRAERGCAVLMVSHDLTVVMRASDRVICLNGHICCQGTPEAVLDAPEYSALFADSAAALAIYRHAHDHSHDHDHDLAQDHAHGDH
ncbi:MAG: ATP-binding cassette domain-containing protein [Rhodobacteraceae bacterium]|nr:ATP-binding cassette domain-containing protein [Paracoccaceae bacterium]